MAIMIVCVLFANWATQNSSELQAFAATTYSYTSSFMSGGGDISTKFNLSMSGKTLNGVCTQGGPMSDRSGKCTVERLSRTNQRFYLAYYYGYKKGYTSGGNGCNLARAMHYSKYGTAYHQSASKSKEMISNAKKYCQNNGVPDNFVAFECTPTNGAQKFVAWRYYSDGSVKIIKKSTTTASYKTGAYNFSDIKFKVYESKNTSSKCVGTLRCNAEGTTSKLKLSPDGNKVKTYYIKEYASNSYYEINDSWHSVVISPGENKKITIKNTPKYGSLTFNKAFTSDSRSGASVDGYTFTLTNKNDSSVKYTAKAKDGTVTFSKVLLGTYKLTENLTASQLAEGVESVTAVQTVKIKAGNNILNASDNTFYNKCLPPEEPALTVLKTCDDGGSLKGFEFRIQGPDGFDKKYSTDENGKIELEDIKAGKYTVSEVMDTEQKSRYHQPTTQSAILDEESNTNLAFVFENEAVIHPVRLKKISSDGNVGGIGFKITGVKYAGTTYAEDIEPLIGITDENGDIDFGEFAPGKYVLEEVDYDSNAYMNKYPLNGYENPAIAFDVTVDGVFVGNKRVDNNIIEFQNAARKVLFTKKEVLVDGTITDNPVANAEYALYKQQENDDGIKEEMLVGTYMTDENGQFTVEPIDIGDYVLYETVVPTGYVDESVTSIDPETGDEIVTPKKLEFTVDLKTNVLELTDTNKQSKGSVLIIKEDQDGNPVEDAQFTLFSDSECTNMVEQAVSDNHGYVIFENIAWGTYYIKETLVPRGYNGSDEVLKVEIGYNKEQDMIVVDYEFKVVNPRKTGTVELLKLDEAHNVIEAPATYELYTLDGTLVKTNLVTGADNNGAGKIIVNDLDWGSYYFLEKEAPDGYCVSDEKIRFTINSMSSGGVQKVTAIDKMMSTYVIATKKIVANDIWWPNGTPTFIFKLTGTSVNGLDKTYYRSVTFSEDYVKKHTDEDGYVSMSATFADIDVGNYTLSEENVSRYELDNIERKTIVNGSVNNDGTVVFELIDESDYGAATFVNKKNEWRNYSSTEMLHNMVKKQKLYTGLTVEYNGKILEGNKPMNNFGEFLDVYALYDDGYEEKILDGDYTVVDVDGNVFNRTPKVAGYYTLTVSHEEDGITHFTTVQIQVAQVKKVLVHFNTMGGEQLKDLEVWQYDTIEKTTSDTSKYTPIKEYHNFKGWYEEESLATSVDISSKIISEETTLYAKWEKKHINEYSWTQIKQLSDSGMAEEYLGECVLSVKEDLADDGKLTSANLKHTKEFVLNGKIYHALIAGFDHDEKSDGSGNAGISFVVYEPVMTARMNQEITNDGGWGESYMRNTVMDHLYDRLPSDLKSIIAPVNKASINNNGATVEPEITKDLLWIPSQVELYGAWGYDGYETKTVQTFNEDYGNLLSMKGEGRQYELFKTIVPDGMVNKEKALIRTEAYWTRSIDFSGGDGFCIVDENGAASVE